MGKDRQLDLPCPMRDCTNRFRQLNGLEYHIRQDHEIREMADLEDAVDVAFARSIFQDMAAWRDSVTA